MSLRAGRRLHLALAYVCAVTLAVVLTLPLVWMLLTSLKPAALTFALPPVWVFNPSLQHYFAVLQRPDFVRILSNTLIVSTVSTAVTLVFGALAAYSMARFQTGGRRLLYTTLIARVLPPVVLGLPFFVLFNRLGLTDTLNGLIVTYGTFALPTVIWIMIPFFEEIPRELEEAAMVDGCSRLAAMWHVTFPLARAGFVVTTVLTFMGAWNQFFFALVLASSKAKTLPLEASAFISDYAVEWGPVSAMACILIIPPVLVVFLLQSRLTRGLSLGGVKG
jgi:multiple sugar transport system permease protein